MKPIQFNVFLPTVMPEMLGLMPYMKALIFISCGLIVLLIVAVYCLDSLTINHLTNFIYKTMPPYTMYLPVEELNKEQLSAEDPLVISILRNKFLIAPSLKPYNLSDPFEINPSMGQAQKVDMILGEKKNGFFIECGALDGETRSNTLFFERERNWKGLLIEADPKSFELLLGKHRKAYTSPTCLSPSIHPMSVKFQQQANVGHIVGEFHNPRGGPEMGDVIDVQCFPLFSYLKALNTTSIDYFSLDIEGAEFTILKTIPWSRVNIKTLSVEFIHDKADKLSIEEYMRERGYIVHSEVTDVRWLANDFIFVKKEFYESLLQQTY